MGHIIEFSSPSTNGRACFKIASSGINFDIKTFGYATLGLGRKLNKRYNILVAIGYDNMTFIRDGNGSGTHTCTPEILHGENYRGFWLKWADNEVLLGKYGDVDPIVRYSTKICEFTYISFLSHEGNNCIHWRVELPPTLKQPPVKTITNGEMHWVHVDNQLPEGAFIGGFEKEHLYIIRAKHRGSLVPGKFVPSEGCGYVAWGGDANEKEDMEVLCGYNCKWVTTSGSTVPIGAVEGGYSEVRREPLYIGRAFHQGYIIPGKVQPSHKVIYIPYNGKEIAVRDFEVLTVKPSLPCVNKIIFPTEDFPDVFRDGVMHMEVEPDDEDVYTTDGEQ